MTDSSGLSGVSTTVHIYQYIEFIQCVRCNERLANDYFQSFQSKILVDISFINRNLARSRYKVYSCD